LSFFFSCTLTYPFAVARARLYQRKPITMPISNTFQSQSSFTEQHLTLQTNTGSLNTIPSPSSTSSSSSTTSSSNSRGMISVIKNTLHNEGIFGLYRGLTLQLFKTAPASAITFLVYETVIKLFNSYENKQMKEKNFNTPI
jgi:hypothetical protein